MSTIVFVSLKKHTVPSTLMTKDPFAEFGDTNINMP